MSTAAPFTPPKKKHNILWWIGGAFILIILLLFLQLFGPSPTIIVSPKTTYIVEPLGPDGLPDYEAHLLQQLRQGVTPENNAAALLWPAMWPGELDPSQFAAIVRELGLGGIPSQEVSVVPASTFISNWLKSQQPAIEDANSADAQNESHSDRIFQYVTSTPWTTRDYPWLAKWVSENQKPLDRFVEASRRPRCYIPSPTLLNEQDDQLIDMLLPGTQAARDCGHSLATRAMWHIGEHQSAEARRDLLALHRLGRLVAQGPTLMDQLVGIAIDGMAYQGTNTLLHEGHLTPEQARQVLQEISGLQPFSGVSVSIDHMERLSFLDMLTRMSRSHDLESTLRNNGLNTGTPFPIFQHVRIDWNLVLRCVNEFYDRYAAAVRLPTYEARLQATQNMDQNVQIFMGHGGLHTWASSTLSLTYRSNAVAFYCLGPIAGVHESALRAQDRANALHDLTRLAAALAVYRAEHPEYPQKLEGLVPGVLEKLPVDLYHAKPFFYKRTEDGYLLYTAGPNGQDDDGSNEQQSIFEGRELDDLEESQADALRAKIPAGADDLSIRVPRPPLKPRPTESNPNQTDEH